MSGWLSSFGSLLMPPAAVPSRVNRAAILTVLPAPSAALTRRAFLTQTTFTAQLLPAEIVRDGSLPTYRYFLLPMWSVAVFSFAAQARVGPV